MAEGTAWTQGGNMAAQVVAAVDAFWGLWPRPLPAAVTARLQPFVDLAEAHVPPTAVDAIGQSMAFFIAQFFVGWAVFKLVPFFNLNKGPLQNGWHALPFQSSARLVAMVHAFLTACMGVCEVGHMSVAEVLASLDTPISDAHFKITCFSLGYFVYDTVYMLVLEHDPLFLMHHACGLTIFGLITHSGYGGHAAMIALAWGEFTNPLLSLWWLARKAKCKWLADLVSPVFTFLFIVIRIFIIPAYAFSMSWTYLLGRTGRSPFFCVALPICMTGVCVGGFIWAKQTITGFLKARRKKAQAKGKTA